MQTTTTKKKTLAQLLLEWEKENGRCWVEQIEEWAKEGEVWRTVADKLGVDMKNLKNFCYKREFKFSWQGRQSKVYRKSKSEQIKNNPIPNRPIPKYYAFGKYKSLAEHCREWGIGHPNTVLYRMSKRGMTLEQAWETPCMTKREAGLYALNIQREKRRSRKAEKVGA